MSEEEGQLLPTLVQFHLHRGGKTAQERQDRFLANVRKTETLFLVAQFEDPGPVSVSAQHIPAPAVEQADGDGDMERLLAVLAGGGGTRLP